jgi:hypothetical protein
VIHAFVALLAFALLGSEIAQAQLTDDQIAFNFDSRGFWTISLLECSNVEVHDLLSRVFHSANVPYAIATDLQGKVSLRLTDVDLEMTLKQIMGQVKGKYRVRHGAYIVERSVPVPITKEDPATLLIPSLDFDRVDAQEAFPLLLKSARIPFLIDSDVRGKVSASLKNVTYETALSALAHSDNLAYRLNGPCRIMKRLPKTIPEKRFGRIVACLDLDHVEVHEAMRRIFRHSGFRYVIDSDVRGYVTVHVKNQSFEEGLDRALHSTRLTYTFGGGVIRVRPRPFTPAIVPS